MYTMRFLELYLLSQKDRSALQVSFPKPVTLIVGGNESGKSTIAKSLYETLGAQPLEVDSNWQASGIVSLLRFALNGKEYFALHNSGRRSIFNSEQKPLFVSSEVSKMSSFYADFLDFRLVMNDRAGRSITPPPSYIFAPFYIDQDSGWKDPFTSFEDLNLQESKKTLVNYHSGIRTNEFYLAASARNQLRRDLGAQVRERFATDQTFRRFRAEIGDEVLNLNFDDFKSEADELVTRTEHLYRLQEEYRNRIIDTRTSLSEWQNHQGMIKKSLDEIRSSFAISSHIPEAIECPTCGAEYGNTIIDRFEIISLEDMLLSASLHGAQEIERLSSDLLKAEHRLEEIREKISKIEVILKIQKKDVQLDDVILARSRTETSNVFLRRIRELDEQIDQLAGNLHRARFFMKSTVDTKRSSAIKQKFADEMHEICDFVGVRAGMVLKSGRISGHLRGRASERTRALFAYYMAFLRTAQEYSSSVFCPIVLDAPNQQGQDDLHLEKIMACIHTFRPRDSQMIIASEKDYGLSDSPDVGVFDTGTEKYSVLKREFYDSTFEYIKPFLGTLL